MWRPIGVHSVCRGLFWSSYFAFYSKLYSKQSLIIKEKFRKVEPGMSETEVEDILGNPTRSVRFPNWIDREWDYGAFDSVYVTFDLDHRAMCKELKSATVWQRIRRLVSR